MKSPIEVAMWLAERFDEDELPYAFGGALALAAWSAPRQTVDVDVAVFVDDSGLPRVIDALERAGAMVDREDASARVTAAGLFWAMLGRTRVDVFLATHPVHESMRDRRRSVELDGRHVWFLSPEDLAIVKLFYGRGKDITDLERLFAAQPNLDVAYVRQWLERIVDPGDRRLGILDDLVGRFTDSSTGE